MKGKTTGGGIIVEPHLCVGCGACTTVCPSGAISYATPRPPEQGQRIRSLLATYRKAGGANAALLIHSQGAGARAIAELGRAARTDAAIHGVPARVLPLEVWHTASVGIELWLSAIAYGASQVWVLMTDEEAPAYRAAVAAQMAVAQAILHGLGLVGEHLRIVDAGALPTLGWHAGDGPARPVLASSAKAARSDPALHALDRALQAAPAAAVQRAAAFGVQAEKRATLDLAIDHLMQQAASVPEAIELAPPSPFGSLRIDTDACTLCLSCVSACPEAALADNPDRPQLRFIEKNCVQCGLCVQTCPEQAITLQPRLWLADAGKARKQPRVLNETDPFCCVRCGKPFGTPKGVEAMVLKLAGHAMFQGAAAERLKMCGDCRIVDIHTNPAEVTIHEV